MVPALIPQLQSPPRVRVEWLIATARAALAAGTLVAAAMDPEPDARVAAYFLSWYLPYSLALLAMVWTPARFAPGWDLMVHIVDVTFFSLWLLLPDASHSPVFVFYVFIVVCATLRWQIAGTVWTAAVAILASLVIGFYAPQFFSGSAGAVGAHQPRDVPGADRDAHRLSRDAPAALSVPDQPAGVVAAQAGARPASAGHGDHPAVE